MVLIVILCIVLLIVLGGGYYAYRIAFFSPNKDRERIPSMTGKQYDPYREAMAEIYQQLQDRPCEFVTADSQDRRKLSARYYHVADGAPVDIAFHGYRSSPMTDFSGGAAVSLELGHNLLLVDQRAHGKSKGRSIAFGLMERYDVISWIDYVLEEFGENTEILLYGISMGAATVLLASELDLPKNVKGIVADCPYSSARDIICRVGAQRGFPPVLCWPFVCIGAKVFGGFNIAERTPADAVKQTDIPILLIHGEADSFVPCSMSREICHANPEMIQLHTFPKADHGLSFLADTPRYKKIVREFVDSIL